MNSKQSIEEAAEKYADTIYPIYNTWNKEDFYNLVSKIWEDAIAWQTEDYYDDEKFGGIAEAYKLKAQEQGYTAEEIMDTVIKEVCKQKAQEQKPVWVKASERLPKKDGEVIWRRVNRFKGVVHCGYENKEFVGLQYNTDDYENIEWLDEYSIQKHITDEEIEVLAEKEYPESIYVDVDLVEISREAFIKGFKAALKLTSS